MRIVREVRIKPIRMEDDGWFPFQNHDFVWALKLRQWWNQINSASAHLKFPTYTYTAKYGVGRLLSSKKYEILRVYVYGFLKTWYVFLANEKTKSEMVSQVSHGRSSISSLEDHGRPTFHLRTSESSPASSAFPQLCSKSSWQRIHPVRPWFSQYCPPNPVGHTTLNLRNLWIISSP